MAAGFLEPLDAPGLALTIDQINSLKDILKAIKKPNYKNTIKELNEYVDFMFNF
jgi:hypothetical protein